MNYIPRNSFSIDSAEHCMKVEEAEFEQNRVSLRRKISKFALTFWEVSESLLIREPCVPTNYQMNKEAR